jgi:hypothetical protein
LGEIPEPLFLGVLLADLLAKHIDVSQIAKHGLASPVSCHHSVILHQTAAGECELAHKCTSEGSSLSGGPAQSSAATLLPAMAMSRAMAQAQPKSRIIASQSMLEGSAMQGRCRMPQMTKLVGIVLVA